VKPEQVAQALEKAEYDLVTVTHNETSTGVMNPLADIARVVKAKPGVLLAVDAVSSMAGVPIDIDGWGVDFIFASVQKAFGLPPGLTVMVASDAALARAQQVAGRGYYFDLVKYRESDARDETPETPSIAHIHALGVAMDRAFAEGVERRYERVRRMAERCRAFARERFGLYPEQGYEALTLTVMRAGPVKGSELAKAVERRGFTIGAGYGKLKDETVRIAHMGEIGEDVIERALAALGEEMERLRKK
jgi:aspartate aminotransferase-like enzyme